MTPQVSVVSTEGAVFKNARPISVGVLPPTVEWRTEFAAGAGGSATPRIGNSAYVGDTVTVVGTMGDIVDARHANLSINSISVSVGAGGGRVDAGQAEWSGPDTFRVPVRVVGAGSSSVSIYVNVPGRDEPISHELTLTGKLDTRQFKDRCSTATARTIEMFSAARVYFLTASNNYRQGSEAHKAALDAQNAHDQLTRDLILGVLFATIGGAAGGVVGSLFKTTAARITKAVGEVASGAATDAAKDLAKYLARLPATFLRGGAGSGGHGAAPTGQGAPTASGGVGGRGVGTPAAQDPFGWYLGVETALETEKAEVSQMLRQLHEAADQALSADDPQAFDWDPMAVLENSATIDGTPLDQLGEVPTADEYERAFWIVWLSQYAWKLSTSVHAATERVTHHADQNVGKDLREAIDHVAARFGESGETWIRVFGAESHARVASQAEQYNRIERGF